MATKVRPRNRSQADEGGVRRFRMLGGVLQLPTPDGEAIETHSFDPKKETIVESDKPLDKMFANQFEALDGPTKRQDMHDDSLDSSGRVMDDPAHVRLKRVKVKNKRPAGAITGREGDEDFIDTSARAHRKGKSDDGTRMRGEDPDDEDLPEYEDEMATTIKSKGAKSSQKGDEDEDEEAPDFGDDVTGDYPDAESVDLKVFMKRGKKGARFTVVDADEPTKALNTKTLKDKKGTSKFIKSQMAKGGSDE